jgi:sulfotransferase family protein
MTANPSEVRPTAAPIVFVGGTGRSGTHVIAKLLCKNVDLALIPVECRFHTDPGGIPDLLAGRVTRDAFVRDLRGRWWKSFQTDRFRGMHNLMERDRLEAAVAAFEPAFEADPQEACRKLFFDLLWWRTTMRKEAVGIVEQSCDTVAQGATLAALFPEARFVHVVRDGRDASASRVAQTRHIFHPRTRVAGLRWWEERIRRIDAGARAIPPERLLQVSIDELVAMKGPAALHPLCRFAGIGTGHRVRKFFKKQMSAERANQGRWREGLSERRAAAIEAAYEETLDRLEAAGVSAAPLLRRSFERSRIPADVEAPAQPLPPLPYAAPEGAGR